ncbi:MAG: ATP-binding protein [Planctomycetota bacterium]|jgi:hypothetical protein
MKTVTVKVKEDHLASLTRVKKPILSIAELVWNSLDANANEIKVILNRNKLGGIDSVIVKDNGHGLTDKDAVTAFENLGGSWKRNARTTKEGKRFLHGKAGKGRFRAFSIGKTVVWKTCFQSNDEFLTFEINGNSDKLGEFQIGDVSPSSRKKTGTEVEVREMKKTFRSLSGEEAIQEITEIFSLYMSLYQTVKIKYDGIYIEPSEVMDCKVEFELAGIELENGQTTSAGLTVVEWKNETDRKLYLCDDNGFPYHDISPGIQAPGFNFTAYVKTDLVRELDEKALLIFEEWHPDLKIILDSAKKKLREHFKERSAERAGKLVEQWKKEKVYPYEGDPQNIIEKSERQVFDLCAINLPRYLPNFEETDPKCKTLSLKLLRHALETSPTAARKILGEVLDLPEDKQEEFAQLLEKTSLEAIISASRIVSNRLDFIKGLEILVFDPKSKSQLLERKQLHRIIAEQTWVFGEEFNLTVDDKSLTEVLKKHLDYRGEELEIDQPVTKEDGSQGIIDLMLSRRVPLHRAEDREHLIVELKRPKQKIDTKTAGQIKEYAFAISEDERFRDVETRWTFWALSNDISESVRKETKQQNRPEGILYKDEEGKLTIWVKTWGQIINDCKARLNFFKESLQYTAGDKTAIEYLRKEYEKYLPSSLLEENTTAALRY